MISSTLSAALVGATLAITPAVPAAAPTVQSAAARPSCDMVKVLDQRGTRIFVP